MAGVHIDHVSICVRDLEAAIGDWREILEVLSPEHARRLTRGEGTDAGTAMRWATFQHPDPEGVSIQLWAPADADSWVHKLLDQRGDFVHHIAFCCDDLDATLAACRAAGLPLVQDTEGFPEEMPWLRWNFLPPDKAHGTLVEIATRYAVAGDRWVQPPG